MYTTRVIVPRAGCRATKAAPCARNMSSSFFPAPFIGARNANPFWAGRNEVDPFRVLEDYSAGISRAFEHLIPEARFTQNGAASTFQPRFDVREVDNAYELRGELPGVEGQDLQVEFTDNETLVIRGRTESERTSGAPEAVQQADDASMTNAEAAQAQVDNTDTASVHSHDSSSSYVKPSVEDEGADDAATQTTTAPGAPTPTESTVAAQETEKTVAEPAQPQSRYWVSERRTGSFQRTFTFATRVDPEGVTASLRNGILNVIVPKKAAPEPRRISVL